MERWQWVSVIVGAYLVVTLWIGLRAGQGGRTAARPATLRPLG